MSALAHVLPPAARDVDSARLGRLAIASLHAELACAPKPGLVTPFSTGSHDDMDAGTFLRSLFALRHYFTDIARAGATDAPFARLRTLGIGAEAAMLCATGGINTHRGAIFSLGLLVAAAARCRRQHGHGVPAAQVCLAVQHWADDFAAAPLDSNSPGQRARRHHGVPGVREQAAAGYPVLRELAVPTLRHALHAGLPRDAALCQTLMQLVARVDDLNLLHRGGADGLAWAQQQARGFVDGGGAFAAGWQARLHRIGEGFVARRLSPGGSADLLACSWFLLQQEGA
ncbi:triphosphoribosyl-dephospho-CoA synthase MdcB [Stenotrophomonas sp. ZAC14D2_NAIMI4_7]|uniref:triphosphoribosyl-dephospho-CoA synthase MdcB n=1 Tax=Stenotrophomonas sp. ZAC14D2_NAIMI4_7 TaxID=2072405 RepID=UPI000D53DE09|nr:triphosphoribosyl-dephospho-CoA synthase MdcB [Stenotrophomonas sp. ZAC14D2_NAIMI4_7]AWH16869.1 triphosphoribosyl-dephospho-CoA synthase MdcB [Stenotrophomonas sp. ZAC14D2_NAIMI4_7]